MKKSFILSVLVFLLFGCSFSYQDIKNDSLTNIEQELSYKSVCRMPFMGGSMLFNAKNPPEGQLQNGVCVAIRLGFVDVKAVVDDEVIFSDNEDAAVYGYLKIKDITESYVLFDVVLYYENSANSKEYFLKLGEDLDINSDGFVDLKYTKANFKRNGLTDSYLLDFISSQDNLNTTMFSVITEQYARSTYPMGLIGINPAGKFIYSLYENNSSQRSCVLGAMYGDFVFDASDNMYKKIISAKPFKKARAITESDLELVDSPNSIDFYFSQEQFDNCGLNPVGLLDEIKTESFNFDSELNVINLLNDFLEDYNLIERLSVEKLLELPSELSEINLHELTLEELLSLNRFFLVEYFSEYCPPVDFNNNDITEVFPLLSLLLPKEDDCDIDIERAVSYDGYTNKKNKIEKEFNSYNRFNLLANYDKSKHININASLGIYGKYSILWSNIEGTIAAICFIQAETEVNLKKEKTCSLLGSPIRFLDITKDIMVGYIPLSIGISGEIDIRFNKSATMTIDSNLFAGYTGMYGAKISVGADYGTKWVKWFKIWWKWVYRPKIYIDPYARGDIINKTVYFIGFQDSLDAVNGTLSASITPNVSFTPKVGLCHNTVWTGVSVENGLELCVKLLGNLEKISGQAYVKLYLKLTGKGGIDITVPILNKHLNKSFNVFSVTPVNAQVEKWTVL